MSKLLKPAREAEKIPCLWVLMLQQLDIVAVVGNSDTGKSASLRELALAISAGKQEFPVNAKQ